MIYKFNTQSLISFESNFHAKGDLHFVIYFDFGTTAPTDNCFDPEQKTVCYFLCYDRCFSSWFKNRQNNIQRSYAHAIEQLTSLDYFSQDQTKCINKELVRQLKDIAFDVNKTKCKKKKKKKMMGQMFCVECALVKKLYLNDLTENLNLRICKLIHSLKLNMREVPQLIGKMINALFTNFL